MPPGRFMMKQGSYGAKIYFNRLEMGETYTHIKG